MSRNARTLAELLANIPSAPEVPEREVTGVTLDSRNVVPGGVFLACSGISSHGLDYLQQAIDLGAAAVIWEAAPGVTPPALPEGVIGVALPSLSVFAGVIAANFYGRPSEKMRVVGITGTNGKTSVSHLTAQALSVHGQRCAVAGTLGYGFMDSLEPATHTTPDAVKLQALFAQLVGSGADAVAMEVSSHALQQHRVSGVVFETAVFTNLTRDHLDYHGNLDSYAAAKKQLFRMPGLKSAVVNADDAVGREILASLPSGVRAYAFATREESLRDATGTVAILVSEIAFDAQGLKMTARVGDQPVSLRAPLYGRFNALNLLAVFGVLLSLGLSVNDAARAVSAVRPVRGRMQRLGGGEKPLVIVDYAHTPDALSQILAAAREHCSGRLFCVFGCGGDRDRGKRPEMGRIAESSADSVIVTDDNPRTEDGDAIVAEILAGIPAESSKVRVERDRARAIAMAIDEASAGDVIVIAGKGHEDYQLTGTRREYFSDAETARERLEASA